MTIRKLFHYLFINYIRASKMVELYQPTYNPSQYRYLVKDLPKRNCEDRVSFIDKSLNFSKIDSILDIGSLFGYFIFRLAQTHKIFGQGIDLSSVYTAYSRAIADLNEIERVSFATMKLTADNVHSLPKYDLIIFLNVFHHIVHFDGFASADKIMKTLIKKCDYFVFETGQYTEPGQYWTDSLEFMGENPDKWIASYLTKLGFRITATKEFPPHLNKVMRTVYVCQKQ